MTINDAMRGMSPVSERATPASRLGSGTISLLYLLILYFFLHKGRLPPVHRSLPALRQSLRLHVVQFASEKTKVLQETRDSHEPSTRTRMQRGAREPAARHEAEMGLSSAR